MNKAEELVTKLCTKSFLSMWSYPRPRGKDSGKELCDLLVVCDPDIIVFSVKEVGVSNSGDVSVDWKRWFRRAVQESARQIYGAERWIMKNPNVVTKDGRIGLPFPELSSTTVHRVAVALGSKREVPIPSGNLGKGFIHVFEEGSLDIIMRELDTVTDFVKYLNDKEALYERRIKMTLLGGKEDLLAIYLKENRTFPADWDSILVDSGLWADFTQRPEYQRKKEEDKSSYLWDELIEHICEYFYKGELEVGGSLPDVEQALRMMAREDRFSRRVLAKRLAEFVQSVQTVTIRSRYVQSQSGVPYVFLQRPHGCDRNQRREELANRCYVVRGFYPDQATVVGIATEKYHAEKGTSFDLLLFRQEEWTEEDKRRAKSIQTQMGYFKNSVKRPMSEREYPGSPSK